MCDFRVSAVTTKQDLEVPVAVNQDEKELLLMKTLENPHIWYDTEFPGSCWHDYKEMRAMRDLDVFDEVSVDNLSPAALNLAISTTRVKGAQARWHCALSDRG